MRPGLAAALAAAALALPAAPASAAADSQFVGGCELLAVAVPTGQVGAPEVYDAALVTYGVVFSPSGAPVSATVTCTVLIESQPHSATSSGTGVVAGLDRWAFSGGNPAHTYFCLTVDFSDDTPTTDECFPRTQEEIPARELFDAADTVIATAPGARAALCDAVRLGDAAYPDVWGTLVVADDGTVYPGSSSNGWNLCAPPEGRSL